MSQNIDEERNILESKYEKMKSEMEESKLNKKNFNDVFTNKIDQTVTYSPKKLGNLIKKDIELSTETLVFIGCEPGITFTKKFKVTNVSSEKTRVVVMEPLSRVFKLEQDKVGYLAPGASECINIICTPQDQQVHVDEVTIQSLSNHILKLRLECYPQDNQQTSLDMPSEINFGRVPVGHTSTIKIELPNNFFHDLKFKITFDERDIGIFDSEFLTGVLFANKTRKVSLFFTPHKIKKFESEFKLKVEQQGFKTKTVTLLGEGVPQDKQKRVVGADGYDDPQDAMEFNETQNQENFDPRRELNTRESVEEIPDKFKLPTIPMMDDGKFDIRLGETVEEAEARREKEKEKLNTNPEEENQEDDMQKPSEIKGLQDPSKPNEKTEEQTQMWLQQKELRRMWKEDQYMRTQFRKDWANEVEFQKNLGDINIGADDPKNDPKNKGKKK